MVQHAEKVQGFGVLLFLGQNLLIQLGRRRQLARLVHFDGSRQNVLHGGHNREAVRIMESKTAHNGQACHFLFYTLKAGIGVNLRGRRGL